MLNDMAATIKAAGENITKFIRFLAIQKREINICYFDYIDA